jgi:hypothetical protein
VFDPRLCRVAGIGKQPGKVAKRFEIVRRCGDVEAIASDHQGAGELDGSRHIASLSLPASQASMRYHLAADHR